MTDHRFFKEPIQEPRGARQLACFLNPSGLVICVCICERIVISLGICINVVAMTGVGEERYRIHSRGVDADAIIV